MGSFFTNVQVRPGDGPESPFAAAMIEAIVGAADGFEVVEDEAGADRIVRVLPPDEGGWIAIYDLATESQDPVALDALGVLACEVAGAPAFSVTVHDSDILLLTLFEEGAVTDRYNSFPHYFDPPGTKPPEDNPDPGEPARWANALGVDAEALSTIWNDDVHAEVALHRTAELLNCSPERACLGFRYAETLPTETVSVALRSVARPAWETPASGPPRLELQASPAATLELAANDGFRTSVSCRNLGGAGRGLTLSVWGSAIEQGLVVIERFELLLGAPSASNTHHMLTPQKGTSREGPLLFVDDADLSVPAGSAAPAAFAPGVDIQALMQAMQGASVHVNLVGTVEREGEGSLGVGFVPHDNRTDGQVGTKMNLRVGPELRKPLRFAGMPGMPVASSAPLLQPLAGRSRLGALLVFDAERDAAVELSRAWVEEAGAADAQVNVYRQDPKKTPKTRTGPLKAALALRDMRNELMVMANGAGWGFAFGTGVLANHEEQRVITLMVSSSELAREPSWKARIDAAVQAGHLLQASLFRSDDQVSLPGHTAYEAACRLSQTITTLRTWCSRWVRVPGNVALWLGPELGVRANDARAAIEEVADVCTLGEGLRIELRDEAAMDRFEHALAELLPSAEDARAAMMVLHGRS